VAVPLVLHLLNKGFPRHYYFPSIELIKATMARRSKVHRWRHWILLLLRTLILALLVLVFLRPVMNRFNSNLGNQDGRQVLILIDHSYSMEDKGDGPSSRERAMYEANKLIDSLGANDSVNVVLMDSNPSTCFVNFSKELAQAKEFVSGIKPGYGRADVNLATAAAARLAYDGGAHPEVYYISDFERKKWSDANFTALPPNVKLFFVDAGPGDRNNRAILDARPAQTEMLAGDVTPLEIAVGNFSDEAFDDRVTVTVDKRYTIEQEVTIEPWSQEKMRVPVPVGGPGAHLCEVRLPPDALDCDNHYYLTLTVQEKEEVPIITDTTPDEKSAAFFLKTALNPYENEAGSLLPRIAASAELTPERLAGTQTLFMTGVGQLTPQACDALGKFMFRGGGVIYFLDGTSDAENLAALEKITGPGTMPMRLARRIVATNVTSGAQQIVRGQFDSPYLKLFQGDARQNLALLQFYDYYQAAATGAGGVVLEFGDKSPAMASLHYGAGTMLLLNFSAAELSSNLARTRLFPAWVQNLVKTISTREAAPASYPVGETLRTEIWKNEMRDELNGPSGGAVETRREVLGERCSVIFTPGAPGFYTMGATGAQQPEYAFGVNPPMEQSDLREIDKSLLPTEFNDNREAHVMAGGQDYDEVAKGRPIFHWFVFAVLACLLMESGFQLFIRRRAAA